MSTRGDWEIIKPLGSGGQSDVFLVRSPSRKQERKRALESIAAFAMQPRTPDNSRGLADAIAIYNRSEASPELGTMKVFKSREAGIDSETQMMERLECEISVLQQERPGLLHLLDSNNAEHWIVTDYYPDGSLEKHLERFKGRAKEALSAFRTLVADLAPLHQDGTVHRDIKPANVFITPDNRLVLGDFGIVFLGNSAERVTMTHERVGPRDYMPPWADVGSRLTKVDPTFDIYMLGILLWCMISGRMKLPREYFQRDEFNLTVMFSSDPDMHLINSILKRCIVEEPDDCFSSADDLLLAVQQTLWQMEHGGQMWQSEVPKPCRVCGLGFLRLFRCILRFQYPSAIFKLI